MGFNDINLQISGPQQPASIYKTKVLKGQVPFATQVTEPNTKYVIKHNFELDDDVTIPTNCILEFDGGSISGEHTITGQNTGINAGLVKIFNTNVTLAGSWNVVEAYPEWFGANESIDCTVIFNHIVGNTTFKTIYLNVLYKVNKFIINRDCTFLSHNNTSGFKALTENGNTLNIVKSNSYCTIIFDNIHFDGSCLSGSDITETISVNNDILQFIGNKRVSFNNCKFHNFGMHVDYENLAPDWAGRDYHGLRTFNVEYVDFESCDIYDFYGVGIEKICIASYTQNTIANVNNCKVYGCTRSQALFLLFNLKKGNFTNNSFVDCGITAFLIQSNNISILNNYISGCSKRGITSENNGQFQGIDNITIIGNIISDCITGGISIGARKKIVIRNNTLVDTCKGPNTSSNGVVNGSIKLQGAIRQASGPLKPENIKIALPFLTDEELGMQDIQDVIIEGNNISETSYDNSGSANTNISAIRIEAPALQLDGTVWGKIESIIIENNNIHIGNIPFNAINFFGGYCTGKIEGNNVVCSNSREEFILVKAFFDSMIIDRNRFEIETEPDAETENSYQYIVVENIPNGYLDNFYFTDNIVIGTLTEEMVVTLVANGFRNIVRADGNVGNCKIFNGSNAAYSLLSPIKNNMEV